MNHEELIACAKMTDAAMQAYMGKRTETYVSRIRNVRDQRAIQAVNKMKRGADALRMSLDEYVTKACVVLAVKGERSIGMFDLARADVHDAIKYGKHEQLHVDDEQEDTTVKFKARSVVADVNTICESMGAFVSKCKVYLHNVSAMNVDVVVAMLAASRSIVDPITLVDCTLVHERWREAEAFAPFSTLSFGVAKFQHARFCQSELHHLAVTREFAAWLDAIEHEHSLFFRALYPTKKVTSDGNRIESGRGCKPSKDA